MALKLVPVMRRRKRGRIFSIPVVAAPMLALLLLVQVTPLLSPLGEREAPLAIAARYAASGIGEGLGDAPSAAAGLTALGSSLLGTGEARLRALGVLTGCAALGLLTWLGDRLFSVRAGVVAAVVFMITPFGRSALGTELSTGPLILLATLITVGAIRDIGLDRTRLIHAGVGSGIALAVAGIQATWLLLFALLWLHYLRGLNSRSCAIALGIPAATAIVIDLLCSVSLGLAIVPDVPRRPLPLRGMETFVGVLPQLLPALPLAALGAMHSPKRWRRRRSVRFLVIWGILAVLALATTGAIEPLWLALCVTLGLLGQWALENAAKPRIAVAAAACALLVALTGSFEPKPASFEVDRWAAREAGKFIRRNIPSDARIGSVDGVRARLTYYTRRPIAQAMPATCTEPSLSQNGYGSFFVHHRHPSLPLIYSPFPLHLRKIQKWQVTRSCSGRTFSSTESD